MAENTNTTAAKPAKKSFFKGVRSEFKKITWPTPVTLVKETGVVIVISIILGAFIALIDWIMKAGIDKIVVR